MPTFEIAYGDAGWNEHSSLMGNFSFETLPKTSDEAHIWIHDSFAYFFKASSKTEVPDILVSYVSIGASKLVFG